MEIPCPHCGKLVNPASLLAQAGAGVPRSFTAKERERRRLRMVRLNKERGAAIRGPGHSGMTSREREAYNRERRAENFPAVAAVAAVAAVDSPALPGVLPAKRSGA